MIYGFLIAYVVVVHMCAVYWLAGVVAARRIRRERDGAMPRAIAKKHRALKRELLLGTIARADKDGWHRHQSMWGRR